MNERMAELVGRIQALEREIDAELEARRKELGYKIERDKVRFEEDALKLHRRLKKGLTKWLRESSYINILTSPMIYAMVAPLMFLDVMLSVYQLVCFPGYGIRRVDRSRYIVLDRGKLQYLNLMERINCDYCAYANGLIAYAREVAGRTEQYFCPIKHALAVKGLHEHYRNFFDYGDAKAYQEQLQGLREKLWALRTP